MHLPVKPIALGNCSPAPCMSLFLPSFRLLCTSFFRHFALQSNLSDTQSCPYTLRIPGMIGCVCRPHGVRCIQHEGLGFRETQDQLVWRGVSTIWGSLSWRQLGIAVPCDSSRAGTVWSSSGPCLHHLKGAYRHRANISNKSQSH